MRPIGDHDRRPREPLADAEIVRRLARQGFDRTGRDWMEFAEAMIEYGYSVFKGWLVAGIVYNMAASHGRSGVRGISRVPQDLRLTEEDAHDLATLLLEAALPHFHATLRDGGWRPDGGAALSTFFIGRCLMDLPDVYERWNRQRERWSRELADADDDVYNDGWHSEGPDPADAAVAAVHLEEVLPPTESEHVRPMIELLVSGYTMAEIADMFSKAGFEYSEATIRTRLSRARGRARERRDQDEGGALDG